MKNLLLIGIDPGTKTGLAMYLPNRKSLIHVGTHGILDAMREINQLSAYKHLVIEDARLVKYKTSKEKAQGAGSVKRDCSIWQEFCEYNEKYSIRGFSWEFVRPSKSLTKWNSKQFQAATGWKGRTSEHARDAAMLVFGKKFPKLGSGVIV